MADKELDPCTNQAPEYIPVTPILTTNERCNDEKDQAVISAYGGNDWSDNGSDGHSGEVLVEDVNELVGEKCEETVSLDESAGLGKTARGDMFNLAGNVKVTWKEVPGANYYKVYREGITDPSESVAEPVIVTSRPIGWDKQAGLTDGHKYRYKIVASFTGEGDDSGNSPLSYSKIMYRLRNVAILSAKNTETGKVTVKYCKTFGVPKKIKVTK